MFIKFQAWTLESVWFKSGIENMLCTKIEGILHFNFISLKYASAAPAYFYNN